MRITQFDKETQTKNIGIIIHKQEGKLIAPTQA